MRRARLLPLVLTMLCLGAAPLPVRADQAQFDLAGFANSANAAASQAYQAQQYAQVQQLMQAQRQQSLLPPAANAILSSGRTPLPVVSTGSVDFNTCDMPFLRSNGGNGAFSSGGPSGAGGSAAGNGSSGQAPALPPGWAGVMCHGVYAGAIPPGGNIVDFWHGAYGFAGDAQQQAALLEEGKWLEANGQLDGL